MGVDFHSLVICHPSDVFCRHTGRKPAAGPEHGLAAPHLDQGRSPGRHSVNRIPEGPGQRQLLDIQRAVERNRAFGFRCRVGRLPAPLALAPDESGNRWLYRVRAWLRKHRVRSEDAAEKQFRSVLAAMHRAATSRGWSVKDPEELNTPLPEEDKPARPAMRLPVLDEKSFRTYFEGIFERDPHVRVVHKAVASFLETAGEQRSHVLLYGLPAGCKTTVLQALKSFYERDGVERVAMLDATTLTKAGLEIWFLERAKDGTLPEVLRLEEIEKHQPDNLLSLLSVMASGELVRTNSRIGRVKVDAKVLVWATCNDEQALKAFHRGALWSRFSHRLYCARPSRGLMKKILLHKVRRLPGGDPAWVEPALAYAYDEVGDDDPRFIGGLLDGREGLLDGSYLGDLRAVAAARREEEERRGIARRREQSPYARIP